MIAHTCISYTSCHCISCDWHHIGNIISCGSLPANVTFLELSMLVLHFTTVFVFLCVNYFVLKLPATILELEVSPLNIASYNMYLACRKVSTLSISLLLFPLTFSLLPSLSHLLTLSLTAALSTSLLSLSLGYSLSLSLREETLPGSEVGLPLLLCQWDSQGGKGLLHTGWIQVISTSHTVHYS